MFGKIAATTPAPNRRMLIKGLVIAIALAAAAWTQGYDVRTIKQSLNGWASSSARDVTGGGDGYGGDWGNA